MSRPILSTAIARNPLKAAITKYRQKVRKNKWLGTRRFNFKRELGE